MKTQANAEKENSVKIITLEKNANSTANLDLVLRRTYASIAIPLGSAGYGRGMVLVLVNWATRVDILIRFLGFWINRIF